MQTGGPWEGRSPERHHSRARGHLKRRVTQGGITRWGKKILKEWQRGRDAHLHFSSDEEASDADELQPRLEDVSLRGHEAIKVVLSVVVRLAPQLVHLADLRERHENTAEHLAETRR